MSDDSKRASKDNTDLVNKPRDMVRGDVAPRGAMGVRPQGQRPTLQAPSMGQGMAPPSSGGSQRGQAQGTPRPPQPRPTLQNLQVGANDRGKLGAQFTPQANRPAQARPTLQPMPVKAPDKADKALGMRNTPRDEQRSAKAQITDKPQLFTKPGPAKSQGQAKDSPTQAPQKSKGIEL